MINSEYIIPIKKDKSASNEISYFLYLLKFDTGIILKHDYISGVYHRPIKYEIIEDYVRNIVKHIDYKNMKYLYSENDILYYSPDIYNSIIVREK